MPFLANIPQPGDFQDVTQTQLLQNNQQLNTSFGTDHYPFTDTSANLGNHNQVTNPLIIGGAHPATPADKCRFYAMQDTANVGLIQYSRGPNSAVPSPVTRLHSGTVGITILSGGSTPILDFTGLTRAYAILYANSMGAAGAVVNFAIWSGAALLINSIISAGINLTPAVSGNVLIIQNASGAAVNNVFWTLELLRTS